MKTYHPQTRGSFLFLGECLLICTLALLASSPNGRAEDHPKVTRAPIYDESLDGSKQIDQALAQARKENKRVLIQFGANWCGWCHKLHTLLQTHQAVANKMKSDYVLVLVDVNKEHNKRVIGGYKAAQHGLPVIVVLDADGKQLTTKDTGELEEGDHHDPQKVLAFLDQWAAKRP